MYVRTIHHMSSIERSPAMLGKGLTGKGERMLGRRPAVMPKQVCIKI
jgi:hypothetical protein